MNTLNDIIEKECFKNNPWVLIYTRSEIILEKLDSLSKTAKNIDQNDIAEARIFNETDELKIWQYQGEVKQRLFSISDQTGFEEYKETMLLWGNTVEKKVLKETGLGAEIGFPVDVAKNPLPLKIHVTNYYTYDDNGLVQFKDARLTKITDKNNTEVK